MKRENGGRGGGKDKNQGGNGKWGGEGGGIVADNERDCKTVKRKEDMEGWEEGRKNEWEGWRVEGRRKEEKDGRKERERRVKGREEGRKRRGKREGSE